MREHRRLVGGFEVIEFSDSAEVEALRARQAVPAEFDLRWAWEYGSEVAELRALYEKGKLAQWNAEHDVDWSIPCGPDAWIVTPEGSLLAQVLKLMGRDEETQRAAAFEEIAYLISQLLHGEQAALQLCGQLTNGCEKMDEKWYAASQVADEARHVEVFSKLLQRKLGQIHPISPTLKILLEMLLQAPSVREKTLGMQTLFEGMAVGIMDLLRGQSRNPLLSDVLRRVEQDEARHAAFGVLMMRRVVRRASADERAQMEDWCFSVLEALNANQQLDMLALLGPKYGVEPEAVIRMTTGLPNFAQLNSLPYMHTVVPNLKQLGLLTARSEAEWRRVGILVERREVEALLSAAGPV